MFKKLIALLTRQPAPYHEHQMCPSCKFIRTDKVGLLHVDIYICHTEGSDLWTYAMVYGPNPDDCKSMNACV